MNTHDIARHGFVERNGLDTRQSFAERRIVDHETNTERIGEVPQCLADMPVTDDPEFETFNRPFERGGVPCHATNDVFGYSLGIATWSRDERDGLLREPGLVDVIGTGGRRPDKSHGTALQQCRIDTRDRTYEQYLGVAQRLSRQGPPVEQCDRAEAFERSRRARNLPVYQ